VVFSWPCRFLRTHLLQDGYCVIIASLKPWWGFKFTFDDLLRSLLMATLDTCFCVHFCKLTKIYHLRTVTIHAYRYLAVLRVENIYSNRIRCDSFNLLMLSSDLERLTCRNSIKFFVFQFCKIEYCFSDQCCVFDKYARFDVT